IRVGDSAYLQDLGAQVLLWSPETGVVRSLDPSSPDLLGPRAAFTPGTCDPVCRPAAVRAGHDVRAADRSGFGVSTFTVTSPGGAIWGLRPGEMDEAGNTAGSVVEGVAGAPPVDRGEVGVVSAHGGPSPQMVAVRGGLWLKSPGGQVRWFASGRGPVGKGVAAALGAHGGCVWALAGLSEGRPRVVRLRPGAGPDGPEVPLGAVDLPSYEPSFAIGPRTAWTIAREEQTLVRVPLPRC
ncbi:MAG TPA: hypothetical protein VNT51_01575, partial [Miltoncostaeaceae bacterium]|nr:hypothetical protein [Miltoncostaeaceae bacterium]